MADQTLGDLLRAAISRNATLVSSYREASRHGSVRALVGFATAAAEQRKELGEELTGLLAEFPSLRPELRCGLEPPHPAVIDPAKDTLELLGSLRDAERSDQEFCACLAEACAAQETELAQRFSSMAEQARKRADTARDLFDLLALG